MRRAAVFTLVAALAAFCIVQDRVTAAGARLYVERQRTALAGGGMAPDIDEVMVPAVRRSVQQGLLWSGVVIVVGATGTALLSRRSRRE